MIIVRERYIVLWRQQLTGSLYNEKKTTFGFVLRETMPGQQKMFYKPL